MSLNNLFVIAGVAGLQERIGDEQLQDNGQKKRARIKIQPRLKSNILWKTEYIKTKAVPSCF